MLRCAKMISVYDANVNEKLIRYHADYHLGLPPNDGARALSAVKFDGTSEISWQKILPGTSDERHTCRRTGLHRCLPFVETITMQLETSIDSPFCALKTHVEPSLYQYDLVE
jgi:hypothetical protein